MTDLSFRIKKIYENNLLPFEKVGENWSWTVRVSYNGSECPLAITGRA